MRPVIKSWSNKVSDVLEAEGRGNFCRDVELPCGCSVSADTWLGGYKCTHGNKVED